MNDDILDEEPQEYTSAQLAKEFPNAEKKLRRAVRGGNKAIITYYIYRGEGEISAHLQWEDEYTTHYFDMKTQTWDVPKRKPAGSGQKIKR